MRSVVCLGVLLAGCFYIDPIQPRPEVTMRLDGPIYRGGVVTVVAQINHVAGSFEWRALPCDEAGENCGKEFFPAEETSTVELRIPVRTGGVDSPLTQSIRVFVVARDARGARADTNASYPVENAMPTVLLHHAARSYTIGGPIDLFAQYSDPDGDPDDIELEWEVVQPALDPPVVPADLGNIIDESNPGLITAHRQLVPPVAGPWTVRVTVRDGLGAPVVEELEFSVKPDLPPCLEQWRPIAPPEGSTLPIIEPTVFQVPVVLDDLDGYPQQSSEALFGTTTFAWSILPPGSSARQPLVGATGNSIDLDPGAFTPGDVVELRVEIFDRSHTPLGCPDDAQTCALRDNCLQRQTWRVEIR